MAAAEDQTEAIIFDVLVIGGSFVDARRVDPRFCVERKISLGPLEASAAANGG